MVANMSPRTALDRGRGMSSPAGVIDADQSIWQAALRLNNESDRRPVVLDEGRLVDLIDKKALTEHWPYLPFVARERTLRTIVQAACTPSCRT